MELQSLTPNLMVANVNETLKYYQEKLGFEVLDTVPDKGDFEWGFVKKEEVLIMFQKESSIRAEYPELEKQQGGGALTMYVRVSNINQWYEQIHQKVKVIKGMRKTEYGANEFAIEDLNGFILAFSDILM